MDSKSSKEKEVIVDIDTSHDPKPGPALSNKWGKKSLNKLVSGVLGYNGSTDGGPTETTLEYPNETTGLLVNENHGPGPEKKKIGKVKNSHKPPRPPRGPLLDAFDMRLMKEISKIAMKKRERIERIKTLKKMKAARTTSASTSSLTSSGSTIVAMVVTVLFFLVLILQGLGSSSSSNMRVARAPRPAPETTGGLSLTPVYAIALGFRVRFAGIYIDNG
ncbi:hypothetical protein CASFOL_002628 [Castilleja foliolosa]|uniref:Transmembrane protein n=1 Tax=Castilleja foliolosa TaxID=1961234 RepID=A0ABD3EF84_9LAMI